jgi:hypothetical protein
MLLSCFWRREQCPKTLRSSAGFGGNRSLSFQRTIIPTRPGQGRDGVKVHRGSNGDHDDNILQGGGDVNAVLAQFFSGESGPGRLSVAARINRPLGSVGTRSGGV